MILLGPLDFSKIQLVNTTFVADNLREQESDLVFLLPFRDADETEVMIYILIEHQSTIDTTMGFRLLFYMCQIWDQQRQKWVSENVPKGKWRFRPMRLSVEETTLMQSMAEHYLQQGIEQGARATTIQNILSVLNTRFPEGDAQSVEQALESVRDLDQPRADASHGIADIDF